MPAAELRRFADEHLDGASRLLGARHQRHREAEPLLAEADAAEAVERAWRREGVAGTVALRDGDVAGYLLGQVGEARHFGRHAWVGHAGHAATDPPEPGLGVPAGAIYLASTATLPEVRGEGVGLALTHHFLEWAREAGHATVVTNWRATNLLASRFWPARGFRIAFVRMHRAIGVG